MGIFQSWAQMVEAFRPQGAERLWSAANLRVYGGGVGDTAFLRRLSELAGDYDTTVRCSSVSSHGGSRSRSVQRRPIYSVAALARCHRVGRWCCCPPPIGCWSSCCRVATARPLAPEGPDDDGRA